MRINSYALINNSGYPALVKECGVNYPLPCENAKEISVMMNSLYSINQKMEEEFWVLCFSTSMKLLGIMPIAKGGYDACYIDNKSLFSRILLLGATNIIITHNHPSNNPRPSSADLTITEKIRKAAMLLDINLLDHIILGGSTFYSFKEHGLMQYT